LSLYLHSPAKCTRRKKEGICRRMQRSKKKKKKTRVVQPSFSPPARCREKKTPRGERVTRSGGGRERRAPRVGLSWIPGPLKGNREGPSRAEGTRKKGRKKGKGGKGRTGTAGLLPQVGEKKQKVLGRDERRKRKRRGRIVIRLSRELPGRKGKFKRLRPPSRTGGRKKEKKKGRGGTTLQLCRFSTSSPPRWRKKKKESRVAPHMTIGVPEKKKRGNEPGLRICSSCYYYLFNALAAQREERGEKNLVAASCTRTTSAPQSKEKKEEGGEYRLLTTCRRAQREEEDSGAVSHLSPLGAPRRKREKRKREERGTGPRDTPAFFLPLRGENLQKGGPPATGPIPNRKRCEGKKEERETESSST